ncbi:hypothetical protein D3C76_178410 [compost metagenome]
MVKVRSIDIVFLLISLVLGGISSSLFETIIFSKLDSSFDMKLSAFSSIILVFTIFMYYVLLRGYYKKIKNETIVQLSVSIFMISLLFASFLAGQMF